MMTHNPSSPPIIISTHGYQVSYMKPKMYRSSGILHQFKLDLWDFTSGPSILAAFGSHEPNDVSELRMVLKKILENSPMNADRMGLANIHDMNYNSMSSLSERSNGKEEEEEVFFFSLRKVKWNDFIMVFSSYFVH